MSPDSVLKARVYEPCILDDVKRINRCIPEGYERKYESASLFLFGVTVGARAKTCAHVNIGDIKRSYLDNKG